MHPHIDWFNMMAYDIHGSWDTHAGANSDMEYISNTVSQTNQIVSCLMLQSSYTKLTSPILYR